MDLLDCLQEQMYLNFTGKVNILENQNKKWRGEIYLVDGNILHAKMDEIIGEKGFAQIYIRESENEFFQYVFEPEIVEVKYKSVHSTMDQLKTKLVSWLEEHLQLKKFRPPANIRFIIRPEFIKEGDPVNSEEFKLMTILCDYSEVTDIYENSSMLEFEITKHLMNLRKKNAIKIIAKD